MNIKLFSGMLGTGTRPTPSTSSSPISNLAIGMGTEQEIGIYDVLRQITENWITWIQELRLNMWFAGRQKIWFIVLQFVFEEVLFPVFIKPISETIIWYQILMRLAAPLAWDRLLETKRARWLSDKWFMIIPKSPPQQPPCGPPWTVDILLSSFCQAVSCLYR